MIGRIDLTRLPITCDRKTFYDRPTRYQVRIETIRIIRLTFIDFDCEPCAKCRAHVIGNVCRVPAINGQCPRGVSLTLVFLMKVRSEYWRTPGRGQHRVAERMGDLGGRDAVHAGGRTPEPYRSAEAVTSKWPSGIVSGRRVDDEPGAAVSDRVR